MGCICAKGTEEEQMALLAGKPGGADPDLPANYSWPNSVPTPPGSLPIINHSLILKKPDVGEYCMRFCEDNDTSLMGLKIGSYPLLVACGVDAVHEILLGEAYQGRMANQTAQSAWNPPSLFTAGPPLSTLERNLLDYGVARFEEENGFGQIVNDEVDCAMRWFEAQAEKGPFAPRDFIIYFIAFNLVNRLMLNMSFEADSKEAKVLVDAVMGKFRMFGTDPQEYVRCLRSCMSADIEKAERFKSSYERVIRQHFDSHLSPEGNAEGKDAEEKHDNKDVIDFMMELRKTEEEEAGKFGEMDDEVLFGIACVDMHSGGISLGNLIDFCLVFLINHPDIVEKISSEVKTVCPNGRPPKYEDHKTLIYTKAFCKEVMRFRTVTVFAIGDRTTEATSVKNYRKSTEHADEVFVPDNCMVLANLWAVHHSKQLWKNPEKFQPERFIEEKQDEECPMSKKFMPFGNRKSPRPCVVPKLIFHFAPILIASIVQNFRIHSTDGNPLDDRPSGAPACTVYAQDVFLEKKFYKA